MEYAPCTVGDIVRTRLEHPTKHPHRLIVNTVILAVRIPRFGSVQYLVQAEDNSVVGQAFQSGIDELTAVDYCVRPKDGWLPLDFALIVNAYGFRSYLLDQLSIGQLVTVQRFFDDVEAGPLGKGVADEFRAWLWTNAPNIELSYSAGRTMRAYLSTWHALLEKYKITSMRTRPAVLGIPPIQLRTQLTIRKQDTP